MGGLAETLQASERALPLELKLMADSTLGLQTPELTSTCGRASVVLPYGWDGRGVVRLTLLPKSGLAWIRDELRQTFAKAC